MMMVNFSCKCLSEWEYHANIEYMIAPVMKETYVLLFSQAFYPEKTHNKIKQIVQVTSWESKRNDLNGILKVLHSLTTASRCWQQYFWNWYIQLI